ncbi:uncharacterized, partial [Tachysurus ichikawai]
METKRYSQQRPVSVTETNTILSQHRAAPTVRHYNTHQLHKHSASVTNNFSRNPKVTQ